MIELVSAEVIIPLRHRVLRPGRPYESAQFQQDTEPDTFHLAARDDAGTVVGCATFFPSSLDGMPAWQLRGMATVSELQGKGIGGEVLEAGVAEVARRGGAAVWCNGRVVAAAFYRRHGFVSQGEEFLIDPSGPHFRFLRTLTAR